MKKETKDNVIRISDSEKIILEQIRNYTTNTTTTTQNVVYENKITPIFYDNKKSRILIIGDLHAPFDLDEYLNHCKKVYKEFNCDTVIFIGDIIDNHYSSYHETNPDGISAGDELQHAINRIQRYYKAFPDATVIIGNHDRMAYRKAFTGGISKHWIKDYSDVLNTPRWNFTVTTKIDDVVYIHGEGGTVRTRIKSEHESIVQGHLHTQAYIEWIFNSKDRVFGLQVGTGIDFESYAFAYAKAGKKPAVSCGVVLNGKYPFLIPMEL